MKYSLFTALTALTALTAAFTLSLCTISMAQFTETLLPGATGDTVVEVQEKLLELGYLASASDVDGAYGAMSVSAVVNFQMANSIETTGLVDAATYEALMGSAAEDDIEIPEIVTLTPDQLYDNAKSLIGCKFDTVVTVAKAEDRYFNSNAAGSRKWATYDFTFNFSDGSNPKKLYNVDDVVEVSGTINEVGFGLLSYDDCTVVCTGSAAETKAAEIAASADENQKVIELVQAKMAKEAEEALAKERSDYAADCSVLLYTDIQRNPKSFKGQKCVVSGKVIQVVDGWFDTVTLRVEDSSNASNVWYASYVYGDSDSHFLNGDKVTLYGECTGTETYSSVLGNSVTVPSMSIKYYEFK